MSAIYMTCPKCGANYIAGMVGSTPWPAHRCKLVTANLNAEQQQFIKDAVANRRLLPEKPLEIED